MVSSPCMGVLLCFLLANVLVRGACNNGQSGTLSYSNGPGSTLVILSDIDGAGARVTYKPNIDCTWDYECPSGSYAAVLVVGQLAGADFVSLMYLNNTVVQTLTDSAGFYPSAAISSGKGADPTTLVFPTSSGRLRFFSGASTSVNSVGFNATFTCRRSQCSLYNDSSPLLITHLPWTLSSDSDGDGSAIPSAAGEACEWGFNLPDSATVSVQVRFGSLAPGEMIALYNGSSSAPLVPFSSSAVWSIPVEANSTSMAIRYSTGTGLASRNGFHLTMRLCRVFNLTSQVELPYSRFMTFAAFQSTASVQVSDSHLLFSDCVLSSFSVVAVCQPNSLLSCGITLQRSNLTGSFRVTASNNATVRVIDSTLRGSIFNLNLVSKSIVKFERCFIHSTDSYWTAARVSLAMKSALILISSTVFALPGSEVWFQSNYASRSLVLILNSTVNCPGTGWCEVWNGCSSDLDTRVVILDSIVLSGGDIAYVSGNVPNVTRSLRTCYKESVLLVPPAVSIDDLYSSSCSPATTISSSWVNKSECMLEEFCDPRFTIQVVGNRTNQSCTCICDVGFMDCSLSNYLSLAKGGLPQDPRMHSTSSVTQSATHSPQATDTNSLLQAVPLSASNPSPSHSRTFGVTSTGRPKIAARYPQNSSPGIDTFTATTTERVCGSQSATSRKVLPVELQQPTSRTGTRSVKVGYAIDRMEPSTVEASRTRSVLKAVSSAASVSSALTGILSPQAAIHGTRLGLMNAPLRCILQEEPGPPEVGQFVFAFGILPNGEGKQVEPENQFAGGCLLSAVLVLLFTFSGELLYRVQGSVLLFSQAQKAARLASLLELTAAMYFLPNIGQGLVLVARRSGDTSLLIVTAGSAFVAILPLALVVYRSSAAFDSHLLAELQLDEVSGTKKWKFAPHVAEPTASGQGGTGLATSEMFLARTAPLYDSLRLPGHRWFRLCNCVDVLFSLLIGCAAGWFPSAAGCSGQALFVVCVCVASTIWSVAVRPPWGKIDLFFHVVTNVLLLSNSGLGFAIVRSHQDALSSPSSLTDAKEIIALLASSCFLAQLVVMLFWQVALWHRRRVRGFERVGDAKSELAVELAPSTLSAPLLAADGPLQSVVLRRNVSDQSGSESQRTGDTMFNPLVTTK
jgi:hypothetical protein